MKYLRHVYDTHHQYKAFEELRKNLKPGEIYAVVDFSENFACKHATEIQSVHFGASKKQISLHTGTFFYKKEEKKCIECVLFGTVSECLRHDAAAIWAHLQPVFELMKTYVPEINTIHFQSNGPSTQYKNKSNFFLMSHYCRTIGLKHATWNFSTPGHGKSFADGCGGTIKNMCDRAVENGKDIMSADDMIQTVTAPNNSKVKMFLITETDMRNIDLLLPVNLKPVPKPNSIFQLIWSSENTHTLYLSSLSCATCVHSLLALISV